MACIPKRISVGLSKYISAEIFERIPGAMREAGVLERILGRKNLFRRGENPLRRNLIQNT